MTEKIQNIWDESIHGHQNQERGNAKMKLTRFQQHQPDFSKSSYHKFESCSIIIPSRLQIRHRDEITCGEFLVLMWNLVTQSFSPCCQNFEAIEIMCCLQNKNLLNYFLLFLLFLGFTNCNVYINLMTFSSIHLVYDKNKYNKWAHN